MISNKELFSRVADVEKAKYEHQLKEPFGIWLNKIIRNNLENYGDMPWMTDLSTGKSMKYGEMIETVDRIGCALRKRGFRASDTVLFIANNQLETAISYLAVWAIEGCPASLGLDSFTDEIVKSKAIETGAKFILADQKRAGQFQNAVSQLNGVQVIVIGGRVNGCIFFDDLLLEGAAEMHEVDDNVESRQFDAKLPAWLGFTSGTTGNPKGIVHSHGTMHLFTIYRRMSASPNPGVKVLATNGLIHCSGVCGMLDNMLGYGHQFVLSETATAHSILYGIHSSKATILTLYAHEVIQIYGLYPSEIEHHQYDLSSVRTVKVPASRILPVYKRYLAELMPNLTQFNNVYAQTETMVLTALPSALSPSRADFLLFLKGPLSSSVGKNFPLVKLKFVDLVSGEKMGPNEMGEIVANTPFLMDGYLGKPEESSKIIRADGWFYTGDVGYYDAEGNVFFLGRITELIRHNKSNKYIVPIKIEEQMSLHPAVKDVVVNVGVHYDHRGTGDPVVKALVSLRNPWDECEALLEEIKAFTNERVSEEEKIRGTNIRFVDNIPRSDVGKIARYKLADKFQF